MATDQGAARAPPPAYNESAAGQPATNCQQTAATAATQKVIVQQPAPAANIRYVDQNGNPVAPPQQQVVIVQQPQPIIKYVNQNGNPVAPPTNMVQSSQVQQKQVIRYVDQNGNPVAAPTNAAVTQLQQVVIDPNAANSTQQFAQGGINCWRVALIVLWSIALAGGIPQFVMGALVLSWSYGYSYHLAAYTLAMLLPGLVAIIGGSISIFGVHSYNYSLSIVSCVASGVLLLFGIILLMVEYGVLWFLIAYIPPFVLYSCLFAFSIIFTKHLSFVRINGHPDPNACCSCGDGGCCAPPPNQSVVYQQPGVALQVGVASSAKDGVQTGTQAPGQVVVLQQNVNGGVNNNMSVVSKAMRTNGGFCWKVTLIILWSFVLAGAIWQFICGAMLVTFYSNGYYVSSWDDDQSWWENYYQQYVPMWTLSLLVPGLIALISAPISIYGVSKYNYKLNVFSCIALGVLLLDGLILLMVEYGVSYFFRVYLYPFVMYSCMFGFSIKFTRKIGYIQENGHADDINADCCKGCYDCCQCQKSCGGCCQ